MDRESSENFFKSWIKRVNRVNDRESWIVNRVRNCLNLGSSIWIGLRIVGRQSESWFIWTIFRFKISVSRVEIEILNRASVCWLIVNLDQDKNLGFWIMNWKKKLLNSGSSVWIELMIVNRGSWIERKKFWILYRASETS